MKVIIITCLSASLVLQVINQTYSLRNAVMAVIPVIFILAETLNEDEFQSQVTPLISVLFQLNDRGIRAALLQRLDSFTGRLDKNAINSTVFEPMCTGFTDSSGALRELTLKSTIPLIPHLNSVNLEKLGRYLVRLQSDTENSIRTNTVIFISKVRLTSDVHFVVFYLTLFYLLPIRSHLL